MKKKIVFCLLITLVMGIAGSASAALVAEYLFDTDGSDTSGFGNNATLENGAVIVADPLGVRGNVLDVSANSGSAHALVTDNAQFALTGGAGTLDFWVLNDGSFNAGGSDVIIENEWDDYTVQRSGSTNFAYSKWNGDTVDNSVVHTVDIYDGQWHHITTWFDETAGTRDYTIDGVTISDAFTGTLNQTAGDLYIGAYSNHGLYTNTYSWQGYIDDLRIYDIKRDQDPVADVGTIDPCSISVTEDPCDTPSDTYTITLTEQPPAGATFRVYLDPNDLWGGSPYLEQVTVSPAKAGDPNTALDIVFDSANWDTPVTVTVTAFNDTIGEFDDLHLTLNHSLVLVSGGPVADPNWAKAGLANSALDVAVADDDMRYAVTIDTIDPCGIEVSEQDPCAADVYTVVLEKQPGTPSTLEVVIETDGQTTVAPTSLVFSNSDWDTPQTVSVYAVDDTVGEDETHTGDISHSVPMNLTWNTVLDEPFDSMGSWTGVDPNNAPADPDPADDLAIVNGAMRTSWSTAALAPVTLGTYYRATIVMDPNGWESYSEIYIRIAPNTDPYDLSGGLRIEYWNGGLNIYGGPGSSTVGAVTINPASTYEFVITDMDDIVTVTMTEVGDALNTATATVAGVSGIGVGSEIAFGHLAGTASFIDWLSFKYEEPTSAPTADQLEWADASIEYDPTASIADNDCIGPGIDRSSSPADIDNNCRVDLADFAAFAGMFLDCTLPEGVSCF